MRLRLCLAYAAATIVLPAQFAHSGQLLLDEKEIAQALSHGPWPISQSPDPSNRVSGNAHAIALGRRLFLSEDLSSSGTMSCATCHRPDNSFTETKPRSTGLEDLDRNSLALLNLRHNRWFSWDGRNDNLWAQSIAPLQRASEMKLSSEELTRILTEPEFKQHYTALFGEPTSNSNADNLVNVGKALAAYQETLETGRSPFDEFRDALAVGDWDSAATYPEAAQRGFKIFAGKGNCTFCHSGPLFSNGEFHDAGVPYFIEPQRVDSGRHDGIEALKQSPYTLDGLYSDDPEKSGAWAVLRVRPQHADFGTFRVPGLRNVEQTGPYMHNGSLPTLEDVILHYSDINMERLHVDGEAILEPLDLHPSEVSDLIDFLKSLTGPLTGI